VFSKRPLSPALALFYWNALAYFYMSLKTLCVNAYIIPGHAGPQMAETLRYKPEGREFDSRWRHWDFSLT
jgi:hypothetical protein